jgi:double stranded RNA-specific editase B
MEITLALILLQVLAGIVMTTDADMNDMKVISVSTGTKCINGEYMSVRGHALNGKIWR